MWGRPFSSEAHATPSFQGAWTNSNRKYFLYNSVNATSFWHSRTGFNEPTHPTRNPEHQNILIHLPKLNAHSTSHKNQEHIFLHEDSYIYTMSILGLIRTIHVISNSKSESNMHQTHELYKITQIVVVTFPWIPHTIATLTLSHDNNLIYTKHNNNLFILQ